MRRNICGLIVMLAAIASPIHACSRETSDEGNASTSKAIGSDLPDDGSDALVHLYWVTGGQIFRAACNGRTPILRSNCTSEMSSMSYDSFKVTLDGGLSDTIRELSDEAERIQGAIGHLQADMEATLATIAEIERRSGGLSTELEHLRADLVRFQTFIQEYREQLSLIDAALRRMADRDLQTQRVVIMQELQEYQGRLADIASRIPGLVDQIAGIQTELAELQEHLDTVNARLENLNAELTDVSTRLAVAHDDFEVYEDTLSKLTDGIIYRVLSDNVLYQKNRQFVRRFERIFSH